MLQIEVDSLRIAHTSADSLNQIKSDSLRNMPLAWRIAQNMKGCSPEQIDSVIQANLPEREQHLSTRPDTLSIPGLPGRKGYSVSSFDNLDPVFEMGFFKDNPMFHPEIKAPGRGYSAVSLPYRLWRDDWVTSILLVSFILIIYILNRTRYQFIQQAKDFFFESNQRPTLFAEETSLEAHATLFLIFQLSLLGGLVSFVYAQDTLDLFLSQISPYLLLFIYTGCFLLYFLSKRLMTSFVNWVFFEKIQQEEWNETNSFLVSVECFLYFPLALIFVYFDIPTFETLIVAGLILIISKILLVYKCYSIFFRNLYCLFHLFAYLCALELMPLMALWKSLVYVTDNLIIKY